MNFDKGIVVDKYQQNNKYYLKIKNEENIIKKEVEKHYYEICFENMIILNNCSCYYEIEVWSERDEQK